MTRSTTNWIPRVVAVSATVLLHVGMLQSLTLGSTAAKHKQERETGPGSSAILSSDGTWMTLVIVHLPRVSESRMTHDIASRGDAVASPVIQVASPDPNPAPEVRSSEQQQEEAGEAVHTAGDPVAQSQLFGRYTGQIDSRIRRAWRRPRSPVEMSSDQPDAMFHCSTRIVQDSGGNVTEIELMDCNGTSEWRLSLVRAIQRASPLPSPPDPSVFTNVLALSFDARAYREGLPEHEYERRVQPEMLSSTRQMEWPTEHSEPSAN